MEQQFEPCYHCLGGRRTLPPEAKGVCWRCAGTGKMLKVPEPSEMDNTMQSIFYLDTEFNGFGGELISLALASERAKWYEVREISAPYHPWVRQNVVPKLGQPPMRPLLFKAAFQQFIQQFDNPVIICDWFEDAKHFLSLLEGPTFEQSLQFPVQIHIIVTPPGQPVPSNSHNALSDAQDLMKWHQLHGGLWG